MNVFTAEMKSNQSKDSWGKSEVSGTAFKYCANLVFSLAPP